MMTVDSLRLARPRSGPASSRRLSAALRRAAAVIGRAHRTLERRRQARRLLDLDDHLLADIGLDRLDIERGFGPRWSEPPSEARWRS